VICAVLYLQPQCHPYTVHKLNSFLHKFLVIGNDNRIRLITVMEGYETGISFTETIKYSKSAKMLALTFWLKLNV